MQLGAVYPFLNANYVHLLPYLLPFCGMEGNNNNNNNNNNDNNNDNHYHQL